MYKRLTYFVCFYLISNSLVHESTSSNFQKAMEQMIEQPQPPEGDEPTTGTMSPLDAVCQYLSTNSAKSTFLCNSGLVVKVTLSKSPTEQNLPARQSDISELQTQVQSLMDIISETRIAVNKCRQDMNGFETRLSDIRFVVQEQWQKKGEDHAAPSDSAA